MKTPSRTHQDALKPKTEIPHCTTATLAYMIPEPSIPRKVKPMETVYTRNLKLFPLYTEKSASPSMQMKDTYMSN